MDQAVGVAYPEMRENVYVSVEALAMAEGQLQRWTAIGHPNIHENLSLIVHILYDDTEVLPDPSRAVADVLRASEVPTFEALSAALTPLIDRIGDEPDATYIANPGWPDVVLAAAAAFASMNAREHDD